MSSPLVILNPGHYPGKDPGACGNGLQEATLNVEICSRIASLAPQYGFDTVTVQENELADICSKANAYTNAVLFYSVHCNGGGGTGYEDYVFNAGSGADNYRRAIRAEVTSYLCGYGLVDRGAKYYGFYVLEKTTMPAILTENLFVDKAADAAKLKDPMFLDGLALAHVKGLSKALGTKEVDAVPEWAKEAIAWASTNGIINTKEGTEDFYRNVVMIYRTYKKFIAKG